MKAKFPKPVNGALHNPFPLNKPNGRYSFVSPDVPSEEITLPRRLKREQPLRMRVKE